jgi:cell division protein FtsW
MTCLFFELSLVLLKDEEIAEEQKDAAKREEALKKLIDAELASEEEDLDNYSIEDRARNPMNGFKQIIFLEN